VYDVILAQIFTALYLNHDQIDRQVLLNLQIRRDKTHQGLIPKALLVTA
jgi:hypothetical protein